MDRLAGQSAAGLIRNATGAMPTWIYAPFAFLAVLLVSDFSSYLYHRLSHRYELLWQFHKVHHYPRQLSILAGFRNHPLDQLLAAKLQAIFTTLFLPLFVTAHEGEYGYILENAGYLNLIVIFIPSIITRLSHAKVPLFLPYGLNRICLSNRPFSRIMQWSSTT